MLAGKARYVLGSLLVLVGAVAVVWSVWRPWYDGRDGRHYGLDDVFDGITDTRAQIMGSLFLPMAVAALLALYGIFRRSRIPIALAGLLVLFVTVVWMVRQGQVADGLRVDADGNGLDVGVANAMGGAALMLLGMGVMGRQRRRAAKRHAEAPEHPDDARDDTRPLPYGVRRHDTAPGAAPGARPRPGHPTSADPWTDEGTDHRREPPRAA